MHVIAAKAVALKEASLPSFKTYQEQIVKNAKALAQALEELGFRLVSGGTDNHLMLVDLRPKKLTGKEAEKRLDEANITVNKNAIPFDPEKPFVTSGIRIGTPAVTSRKMDEGAMATIAQLMDKALSGHQDEAKAGVAELLAKYPLYED